MGHRKRTKMGPVGGFGVRYGFGLRKHQIEVITELKKAHKCPQCGSMSVRRESVGIWKCRKCGLTFTGGAYTPATKLGAVAKRSAKGASA
jgi:large subunit ribosomal protein L37Ae